MPALLFTVRPDIAMQPDTALRERFAAVDQHFHQVIVSLWQGPGWNTELALPYEALDAQGQPLPAQRYRAMACARQLYLFSSLIGDARHPYAAERAAALFRSLNKHFHDAEHGGWFYSVDAKGAPLDTRKDLYTHAFIVFACAHYWRQVQEPLVESTLNAALEVIGQYFADDQDLYHAELAQDWSLLGSGPLQNPLMHLTEALLAVLQAREDEHTEHALLALTDAMLQHFVEPKQGVLLEKPLGSADNWFEPGHQYEWLFLLNSTERLRQHPLEKALRRAVAFSQNHGLASNGGVLASLDAQGQVLDRTQRIWAQSEHLRALCIEPGTAQALQDALTGFAERYLHQTGWHESIGADGRVNRHDMPSTTAYHLLTGYQALAAYLQD